MEHTKTEEVWTKSGNIAAIIHIFYEDLIEEIADKTRNLPHETDYYITVPEDQPELLQAVLERFPKACVLLVENRGRDILPFIEVLKRILTLNYDLLIKIHSKKTLHRADGTSWRQDVYEKLLGSPELVASIIDNFQNDPNLGILGPKDHVLDSRFYMGGNRAINRELIKRVGLPEESSLEFPFVASTMFWARPVIFKPIIQADFHAEDFPAEPLPADSTLAHALERFFGLLTVQQGYTIKAIDGNRVLADPNPFATYQFTPAPKALALAEIKSLVYYPAYEEAYAIEHLRITAPYRAAGIELISGKVDGVGDPNRVLLGDAVIFQREFPKNTDLYDDIVAIARHNYKPIIYELDDLLFDLPETHHHRLENAYLNALLPMFSAIIEADLITVPTKALKYALLDFNPNIQVLPNYLDDSIWQLREPKLKVDAPLTIGFMGSNSHTPDLAIIAPVIKTLLAKYEGKATFRIIGTPLPGSLQKTNGVEWQASPSNVYVDFVRFFQTQDFDIFVAPLAENLFNASKSNLKFLEYSGMGVPGVYSAIDPYRETISQGVDGFLAQTEAEWIEHLETLINNSELRLSMAKAAQEKIRKQYLLSKQICSWDDIVSGYNPTEYKVSESKQISSHLINTIRRQIAQYQQVLSQQNANYLHDNQLLTEHIEELNSQSTQFRQETAVQIAKLEHEANVVTQQRDNYIRDNQLLTEHIDELNVQAEQMRQNAAAQQTQLNQTRYELNAIYQDKSWKNYSRYKRARNKLRTAAGRLIRGRNPLSIFRGGATSKDIALLQQSNLFSTTYYLAQNPDVKNAGVNPFKHYLIHGGKEGRQPSEHFDGNWYLEANPDVKNAGVNPLLHYLKFGQLEGRACKKLTLETTPQSTKPLSDVSVIKEIRDTVHVESSKPTPFLEQKQPKIPERIIRGSNLRALLQKQLKNKFQLALSHDDYLIITGGVQVYVYDEQKAALAEGESYLHIYPYIKGNTTYTERTILYVGINIDGKALGHTESGELLDAIKGLEAKTLDKISIHHSMGFTFPFLHDLLKLKANECRFWLHDYYSLCPSYNLMRNGTQFCGGPTLDSNACLICKFKPDRLIQLPEFGRLIEVNDPVIVSPSRFTFEFWQERFPVNAKNFKVIPPARLEWQPRQTPKGDKTTINIAYLGYPLDYKGWKTWLNLTQAMENDKRYQFFQFSTVPGEPGNYKTIETRVSNANPTAMVDGLRNKQIDVVLLWSIWPETFSFTLHEGLSVGAYVLTNPNSGNIQFYLSRHTEQGRILQDTDQLIDLFKTGEIINLVNQYNKQGKRSATLYYGNLLEESL
jgi:glycosyltransferase involved in cell wall biosynthesis